MSVEWRLCVWRLELQCFICATRIAWYWKCQYSVARLYLVIQKVDMLDLLQYQFLALKFTLFRWQKHFRWPHCRHNRCSEMGYFGSEHRWETLCGNESAFHRQAANGVNCLRSGQLKRKVVSLPDLRQQQDQKIRFQVFVFWCRRWCLVRQRLAIMQRLRLCGTIREMFKKSKRIIANGLQLGCTKHQISLFTVCRRIAEASSLVDDIILISLLEIAWWLFYGTRPPWHMTNGLIK